MMAKLDHQEIRRRLAAAIRRLLARTDLPIKFHSYQREAFECMLAWLETEEGHRTHIAHATGLGKTLEFVSLAAEAEEEELRFLIVVPSRVLVVQTAKEIRGYTKGELEVGHLSSLPKTLRDVKDGEVLAIKGHAGQRIVIITQQSFGMRAEAIKREYDPHVIVRDEMHWSYTEPQLNALDQFPDAIIIGYSATPDYLTSVKKKSYLAVELDNGQTLYVHPERMARAHFGECLHRVTLREGIERQFLAPLAWAELGVTISMKDVVTSDGPFGTDYDPKAVIDLVGKSWPTILEVIRRLYEDNEYDIRNRQVAAVCPNIAMAKEFADVIGRYTQTAVVIGTTPGDEREKLLDLFDQDEDENVTEVLRALASVNVLKEGWSSRNVEILFMLRPTRSRVLYEQVVGRLTRKRRDGRPKTGLIIDPHYQEDRFAPLSAPVLYGRPGETITNGEMLIGPRSDQAYISPYLPVGTRPVIRVVQPIQIEYWAGEDGFVEIEGTRCGILTSIAREIGRSKGAVGIRLEVCRSYPGRDSGGKSTTLYVVSDVITACSELIAEDIIQLNDEGMGSEGETLYGSIRFYADSLEDGYNAVSGRLEGCPSRRGRTPGGVLLNVYALQVAFDACYNRYCEVILLNDAGVGEDAAGVCHATVIALSKIMEFKRDTISRHIKTCKARKGRMPRGNIFDVYALPDVMRACASVRVYKKR